MGAGQVLAAVLASDLGTFFTTLTDKFGGVTILVFLGGGAWIMWKRDDMKTVRENNTDLTSRVTLLEADKARLTAERDTAVSENLTLRSVVTGEVKLTQIEGVLEEHHQQTLNWQKTANDKIDGLKRAVEEWSR